MRVRGGNSSIKMAVATPIGKVIKPHNPQTQIVPHMAGQMPAWDAWSSGGLRISPKLKEGTPWIKIEASSTIRIATETAAVAMQIAWNVLFFVARLDVLRLGARWIDCSIAAGGRFFIRTSREIACGPRCQPSS